MSAIRNTNARRSHARSAQLPYSRPAPKKSSWSISGSISGLLSYLNPLKSRFSAETVSDVQSDSEVGTEVSDSQTTPAESLSRRGHQLSNQNFAHSTPNAITGPSSQPNYPPVSQHQRLPQTLADSGTTSPPPHADVHIGPHQPPSPAQNIQTIREFLDRKGSDPLSEVEKQGILYLIEQSTPGSCQSSSHFQSTHGIAEEPERFRFSTTPSTPPRGTTPFSGINGFSFGLGSPAAPTTPSPRKTLNKNPNGPYRWQGGGSARASRSKNRYSSPAFGPSRSTTDRLILKEIPATEAPKTDTKRRRVGDEAVTSAATPSGPIGEAAPKPPARSAAPAPSPTRTKQALPFPVSEGSPSTSRLPNGSAAPKVPTTPVSRLRPPQKPTQPAVPSPLRQAWSGVSPSSPSDAASTPPQKQTKAANFMTELIKEVTPPKRPDLSNPYQTASPVGKVGPPKTRVGRRPRATGKPAPLDATAGKGKEKDTKVAAEKEKVYSPQAIIEATLPKGSKRSRPPAHFEKATSSSRETSLSPTDETPRPREINGKSTGARKPYAAYVVEEIDEDEEETKRATKRPKPHLEGRGMATINGKKSPAPSPTPDIVIEEVEDVDMQAPPEKPQPTPSFFGQPPSGVNGVSGKSTFVGFKSTSAPKEPSKLRFSYQPEPGSSSPIPSPAPAKTTLPLPTPEATPSLKPVPSPSAPAPEKPAVEKVEVPKKKLTPAKEAARALPAHSLPTFVFSVTTTFPSAQFAKVRDQVKVLAKSALPSFDLGAKEPVAVKATVALPPVKAFDWAAAGIKPAGGSTGGSAWTCSMCMLSNPATATDKCTVCDSPR
ncbi:hypothetical protein Hypma_009064 [Hypsizygus marmoreus]|uniref:RanBP2-type domain-containing protein n=1 Tax=Hypsizygus marmoreus TaxID=39966 RepID=A0A369JT23_HYPMA|nr:hypothetical protein Hypma_009064 [Hypsizygus marmoreus]